MIRPISKSRAEQLAIYEKIVRDWQKKPENRICCVPGCGKPADKRPHHSRGRIGRLLLDPRFFKPICWPHHQRVKEDPTWARSLGLLPPHGQYNTFPKE